MVDPLTGYKFKRSEPVHMAEDIFDWPSKRDLVFWPHTDTRWIWHSPHSDYVSFADDFHQLNDQEKERIRHYLKHHRLYAGEKITTEQKLDQMEAIYKLRDKDEAFWMWFNRVMAYWHRDDPQRARRYHEAVVPLLEKELAKTDQGIERIKLLYLIGEYRWRLGQKEQAKEYFARARRITWMDQKGKPHTDGLGYVNDLIEERLFSELILVAEQEQRKKKKSASLKKKQKK